MEKTIGRKNKMTNREELKALGTDPLILGLRAYVENIVNKEVARVRKSDGDEVAEVVHQSLVKTTMAIFHTPHSKPYELTESAEDYKKAINILFGSVLNND
jgi:glutamyl-tRNA reductase